MEPGGSSAWGARVTDVGECLQVADTLYNSLGVIMENWPSFLNFFTQDLHLLAVMGRAKTRNESDCQYIFVFAPFIHFFGTANFVE